MRLYVGAMGGQMDSATLRKRNTHCDDIDANEVPHNTLRRFPLYSGMALGVGRTRIIPPFHSVQVGTWIRLRRSLGGRISQFVHCETRRYTREKDTRLAFSATDVVRLAVFLIVHPHKTSHE
jgi:hypothetical protein